MLVRYKVLKVHRDQEDLKGLMDQEVLKVPKVPREVRVLRVLRVLQVRKGLFQTGSKGQQDLQEHLARQVLKVPKEIQVLRVLRDHQRLLVLHLVVLGVLGMKMRRVILEIVVLFSRIVAFGLPDVIFTTQVNVRNLIVKMGSGIMIVMVLLGR